ncbi:MAG: hypothetical protein HY842_00400, partial [Bacteroidetes bacterium]|nr:hypothetical protein [Bacteroidota bacterium]
MIKTLKNCRVSLSIFIPAALAVLLTNPAGNFPLNDDWQYAYPVKTLVEQNLLEFKGIFAPNILLQIGWGYLFCKLGGGFGFTWLRLSTLAAAVIAMLAFYRLGRKSGIGNSALNFSANMLIFNPLFYSLAFTFMSDV